MDFTEILKSIFKFLQTEVGTHLTKGMLMKTIIANKD
jgi:hypothetical protein